MLILYITYVDLEGGTSGSGVRPRKMYDALLAEGHEVRLLSGAQGNLRTRGTRLQRVKETERWLDSHRPDLCYIESPVYPIMWAADRRLIARVHAMGVPVGYFYRDFYRRFPELYPGPADPVGKLKEKALDVLQDLTDRLLRKADIVYFPSMAAARLFSYADMRALPPAGEDRGETYPQSERNTCIYVGGLGGHYGGEILLRAFELLNAGDERYPLLLVCRKQEWDAVAPELKKGTWLEVHHTSGSGLTPLYRRAELAVLPIEKTAYTDLAVNVKFFEYLSYGLPVASTDVTAIAELVETNGVGCVSEASPEALSETIRSMLADPGAMERRRRAARSALLGSNLWVHRVRQIVRELSEKGRG